MPKDYLRYFETDQDLRAVVFVMMTKQEVPEVFKQIMIGTILEGNEKKMMNLKEIKDLID